MFTPYIRKGFCVLTLTTQTINILKEKNQWTDEILEVIRNPTVKDLHSPWLLENMDTFIKKLHTYKDTNITVVPDYDADGILSGSLLMASLSLLGFESISLYEPRIDTGFGLSSQSAQEAITRYPDTDLIITTDNGSNAHDGVEFAESYGIEVLITDHHRADSTDPTEMVVNPNRQTDQYPNKGLSGTAVIWKVMQAYAETYGSEKDQRLIDLLIVLVGMSTISDVMPLLDENRYFVKKSIDMLQDRSLLEQGSNVPGVYGDVFRGLLALYDISNENKKFNYGFDESTLGFVFGPMLNSPRRMSGSSVEGFNVFLSQTYDEAYTHACVLYGTNEERKKLMREYNQRYLSPIHPVHDKINYTTGVVPYQAGLIGLVAGRFTNEFYLPSIVFGNGNLDRIYYGERLPENIQTISGSGRSPEWFNLHGELTAIAEEYPNWFVSFGGHQQAVGVQIYAKYYDQFHVEFTKRVIAEYTKQQESIKSGSDKTDPTVWLGCVSTIEGYSDINVHNSWDVLDLVGVVEYIETLKPFGQGFQEPQFGIAFSIDDVDVQFMGVDKQHVKFTLPNGLAIIQWNGADRLHKELGHLDTPFGFIVRGELSVNEFMGRETVQLIVDQLIVEK